MVVVFHVLLLSATFADPQPGLRPEEPSWWLTHTPGYLVWAGREAVFLFFVLSGFVLALPATGGRVRWRAYYPQRLLRLYIPVWGSLILAVFLHVLVPREPRPALSDWYDRRVQAAEPADALRDGVLLLGTGPLNSPLWSLQWEVAFSLLLPLYLLLARLLPRLWAVKLGALVLLVFAVALLDVESLFYLSMFGFGVIMALERERIATLARRGTGARAGRLVAAAAVLLLTVEATLLATAADHAVVRAGAAASQMVGACLAVVLALHWEPARRWLTRPWAQWVGVRSFSLYLVHEPLAVSIGVLWPDVPALARLLIVLPVSLVVAHLFHRAVESPAHRLSRAAARRLA